MKRVLTFAVAAIAGILAQAAEPVPIDGFFDGIQHWKNRTSADGYATYRADQVARIADNLLLYQRANGGWAPNNDPLRILNDEERTAIEAERWREDSSFDNRTTYTQVDYLAAAFGRTGDARYRDAALRGIEFILKAQHENGGFPHSYPNKNGYRPHITIVDDVMSGVLGTLRRIAESHAAYAFVEDPLRARVKEALARGDACLLKLQVRVGDQLTGWASQYDEHTLAPTTGRSFELPGLISSESAGVLRYLMSIDPPSDEVRTAIEAGVAWLARSEIKGLRIDRVPAETIRYPHHTSRHDVIVVADPEAPPIWGRFYEIDTNRPFMANRDGRKVYQLSEVDRERRTGYSWYSGAPKRLLDVDYPAWKARVGR